jgi:NAD(P)H-flavin reductase
MSSQTIPQSSIYLPRPAELVKVSSITKTEKLFEFKLQDGQNLGHSPGQFVELTIFGVGEAPISISSSPTKKESFELAIRRTGNLTTVMHRLDVGVIVGFRGPFGNGFPLDTLKGKDILIIAGGIGLFPLRSLIYFLLDNRSDYGRLIVLSGCRTPEERVFADELDLWTDRNDLELIETVDRATDDSWTGNVGMVTTLFDKIEIDAGNTFAIMVGPPVMYRYVVAECKRKNIPDNQILLSLERRMKCGVGKCGHCQINGVYVCQEGPVFTYSELMKLKEAT